MSSPGTLDILPIEEHKDAILNLLSKHQIIICISETGSGKTTQIPQYCLDGGLLSHGKLIGVTQPRRVAAITVADRVSDERNTTTGRQVGYAVRFDDKTSSSTKIKYMTDGILVRECLFDRDLSKYDVIMLDEAHERSLNTDILFGLIKEVCKRRVDLKVIVTSATLSEDKFSNYFNNCPVLHIPGRVFPVDIYHSKMKQIITTSGPSNSSYIESAAELAVKIHLTEDEGHILVFLTGQDEIDTACRLIQSKLSDALSMHDRELLIMPLYSSLSPEAQKKVFANMNQRNNLNTSSGSSFVRKCIVATNIAETSITVPNVRYVIDAGYVKQKTYNPDRHMESLVVVPISQVSSQQRAGRAGRTAPGKCYRLYSSDCYANMMEETIPEILRTNLTNTVLYLKVLGIHDVLSFDFLDTPDESQTIEALILLNMLGAIDQDGFVTEIGKVMSTFPLEPYLSRALVAAASSDYNCVYEVASICAMVSTENIYFSPSKKMKQNEDYQRRATESHEQLYQSAGDHITYLYILNQWEAHRATNSREWCEEHFISHRAMNNARRIRDQLCEDARAVKLAINIPPGSSMLAVISKSLEDRICKSLLHGLYMTAGRYCASGAASIMQNLRGGNNALYRTLPMMAGNEVALVNAHPSSAMTSPTATNHPFVFYQELLSLSGKLYMRHVSKADPMLLFQLQKAWVQPVYPKVLSGRVPPVLIPVAESQDIPLVPDKELRVAATGTGRRHLQVEAKRLQEIANSVSTAASVDDAKTRYLARKKQKV